ncbi:MAG: ParA family protein [Armatimonadota bacterium]
MAWTWAVVNQKGGVGKTTTAINLAAYLALTHRVLLVDTDPQGNATSGVGAERRGLVRDTCSVLTGEATIAETRIPCAVPGLDVLPATFNLVGAEFLVSQMDDGEFRLRSAIEAVDAEYDFVVIDSPPSRGAITINALVAADEAIIPMQCEYFALEGIAHLLDLIGLVRNGPNPDLAIGRVLLTMCDDRTNLAQLVANEVRSFFGEQVSPTVVPRNVKLPEASSFGKPISLYDPRSKGARAYESISRELIEHVQRKNPVPTQARAGEGAGRTAASWWRRGS